MAPWHPWSLRICERSKRLSVPSIKSEIYAIIAREMRVMRRNQLKLIISILMAVVASVLAAGPAFAVTCAVDCNPIRGSLGRVASLQG